MGISVEEINTVLDLQTDSHGISLSSRDYYSSLKKGGMRSSLHAPLDSPWTTFDTFAAFNCSIWSVKVAKAAWSFSLSTSRGEITTNSNTDSSSSCCNCSRYQFDFESRHYVQLMFHKWKFSSLQGRLLSVLDDDDGLQSTTAVAQKRKFPPRSI